MDVEVVSIVMLSILTLYLAFRKKNQKKPVGVLRYILDTADGREYFTLELESDSVDRILREETVLLNVSITRK